MTFIILQLSVWGEYLKQIAKIIDKLYSLNLTVRNKRLVHEGDITAISSVLRYFILSVLGLDQGLVYSRQGLAH